MGNKKPELAKPHQTVFEIEPLSVNKMLELLDETDSKQYSEQKGDKSKPEVLADIAVQQKSDIQTSIKQIMPVDQSHKTDGDDDDKQISDNNSDKSKLEKTLAEIVIQAQSHEAVKATDFSNILSKKQSNKQNPKRTKPEASERSEMVCTKVRL